jgi:four helix bundle protein
MERKLMELRLVDFSDSILKLCRECKFDELTNHLGRQIVRSGSSAALNYGEAQSAESRADFSHKFSIVLKELRETYIILTLINRSGICRKQDDLTKLLNENNELIAIFQKSISTLQKSKK